MCVCVCVCVRVRACVRVFDDNNNNNHQHLNAHVCDLTEHAFRLCGVAEADQHGLVEQDVVVPHQMTTTMTSTTTATTTITTNTLTHTSVTVPSTPSDCVELLKRTSTVWLSRTWLPLTSHRRRQTTATTTTTTATTTTTLTHRIFALTEHAFRPCGVAEADQHGLVEKDVVVPYLTTTTTTTTTTITTTTTTTTFTNTSVTLPSTPSDCVELLKRTSTVWLSRTWLSLTSRRRRRPKPSSKAGLLQVACKHSTRV